MHIQEGTNTTLTTCTKMTEEVDRRHGVNGNSSSKGVNDDPPVHSTAPAATGGRLKFFKGQCGIIVSCNLLQNIRINFSIFFYINFMLLLLDYFLGIFFYYLLILNLSVSIY